MRIEINKYIINIHKEPLEMLEHFTQREKKQHEAGGIILGVIIDEEVNILRLSVPTELDKSSRNNFERHRLSAQIAINHEFFNSNKKIIYLGEWHTHPEDTPSPSPTDEKMINQQFSKNTLNTNFLLLIIKGIKDIYIGVIDKAGLKSTIISSD